MGFDMYNMSELIIKDDDVQKAAGLLKELYSAQGLEYYHPAVKDYGGHHELVLYDTCEVDIDDDEFLIGKEDDRDVIGNLHNDSLYEQIHPYIVYLRDNGVLINGWIYGNYDGCEVSYTFYVDGNEMGYLNELGLGRMCLAHILKDGKIDFDLVNNIVR